MSDGLLLTPEAAPFLDSRGALAVIDLLAKEGAETRFVGGCVRDAILRRPGGDIDLATTLAAERAMSALEAAGLHVVPTGLDHGTITVVFHSRPIEVTTLRRDVETHGRRATVAFTEDWREDAARRDFTINALYADRAGAVFDYFGGVADAEAGRVRFVGEAAERVREDYLRILRYFRFHAWYGRPPPDAAALAAVAAARDGLAGIARERIRHELVKLLGAADPAPACRLMAETGVLEIVLEGPGEPERLARLLGLLPWAGVMARLAALLPPDANLAALSMHLRLSKAEAQTLEAVTTVAQQIGTVPGPREARALAYRHGPATACEAAALAEARGLAPGATRSLGRGLEGWSPPALPIGGRDVQALGIPPGKAVGDLLRQVEAWWIGEDFRPDRDACLERLKGLAGRGK